MATFFGEVRPVSSRAYDEADDDDDDSTVIKYNIRVELTEGGKDLTKAEALLISYGSLATEFCERVVVGEKSEEAGRVYVEGGGPGESHQDTGDFHPRPPVPSHLVTIGSLAVCCVSQNVVSAVATQFVRKVLSLVGSSCPVVVISSHHYGALRGNYCPSNEDNCVIHSLRSPSFTHTPAYPPLPQPAILDSVPAAAMTASLVSGRACVTYPCYTETYSTGDLDLVAGALIKVLETPPLRSLLPDVKLHHLTHKPRDDFDRYT